MSVDCRHAAPNAAGGRWLSRCGGVAEAVLEGETGLLVDPEDAKAAASAIQRLLKDDGLNRAMGDAGRRWAIQHDRKHFTQRLMNIYERVRLDKKVTAEA